MTLRKTKKARIGINRRLSSVEKIGRIELLRLARINFKRMYEGESKNRADVYEPSFRDDNKSRS